MSTCFTVVSKVPFVYMYTMYEAKQLHAIETAMTIPAMAPPFKDFSFELEEELQVALSDDV